MSLRRRLNELLGLHNADDSYNNESYSTSEGYGEVDESIDYEEPVPYRAERESNVITMPGLSSFHSELVVMEPASFQEVPAAIVALRERKVVVLNLSHMDGEEAQRSVDYVAGGTFALNGHQERIGKNVFLFTPHSVQITSQTQPDVPVAPGNGQPQGYPPPPPPPSHMSQVRNAPPPLTQEQEMLRKLELRAGRPQQPQPPRPQPRF